MAIAPSIFASGWVRNRLLLLPAGERYKTLASVQKNLRCGFSPAPRALFLDGGFGRRGNWRHDGLCRSVLGCVAFNVVQVPTSLLAMVDASIGAKLA